MPKVSFIKSPNYEVVAKNIRVAMTEVGIRNKKELSKMTGIGYGSINYMLERKPCSITLEDLAIYSKVLKVPI